MKYNLVFLFLLNVRFLGSLAGFIRNKNHPEASIAKQYLMNENITFLSMHFPLDMETKFNRRPRNFDGVNDQQKEGISVFSMRTRPFGKVNPKYSLSGGEIDKAHWYILCNCEEVEPYLK